MKKVNKKGFTLLEVIVTIGIICVLGLIVVPAIINYRNKSKTEYNNKLQENIIQIAKDYYVSNRDELPNGQVEGKYATSLKLETLRQENYITNDVIDADKNSCTSESFVVVENNRGNYNYYVCLKCGNKTYSTSPSYCEFQNGEGSLPTCELTYNDSWSKENVVININSTDSIGIINIKQNGKVLKTTYDENNKTYNATYEASQSGKYSFDILNKYGLKTTCVTENEIKIDKDVPRCLISKQDKTNTSINLLVTATDDTSSVKSIKIGTTTLGNDNSYKVTANGNYVATVIDSAGNVGTCSIDVSELDDEKPSISASAIQSSIIYARITDNVGVVGYQITESSTIPTTWVKIDSSKSVIKIFEKLKSSTNYYIHAIDEAGNTNYKNVKTGSEKVIIIEPDDPDPNPGPTNPETGGDCWTVGLCDDGGGSSGGTSNPGTGAYVEPDPVCVTGKNGVTMCDR